MAELIENMYITDITSKGTSGHHSVTKISGMRSGRCE